MDCVFCKIVDGRIPSEKLFEDADFIAFRDIHPQSPVHVLIVPKFHITSLAHLKPEHETLMGRLIMLATKIAQSEGLAVRGYRLVTNCGAEGGQVVPHLHFHLIGGKQMDDKMG
ncbi:MAG TPA: histidine triad nucleotide-binding protein [Dehalococcoidia bacterium]|nr:histidine triad nucleotide-binding protein [Dehalococcoidia bacterium]